MDQITLSPDEVVAAGDDTQARRVRRRPIAATAAALFALLLLLSKFGYFLVAKFKLLLVNPFEGFGLAQLLLTVGSMLVSVVAYAAKMTLPFAIGLILILFIHELGHAILIRAKGLRAGAMVFIPFVGGAVTLKRQPRSVFVDAQIGLAGPIAGTIASMIALQIFYWNGQPVYLAIAHVGFILNLFNLTPIGPLDGGRIAAAITKWMWVLGGIIIFAMVWYWRHPLLIVLGLLSVLQVYMAINRERLRRFYAIKPGQRATVAAVYFALVAFLGYQTIRTYELREFLLSGMTG
jgi:Zn-dependent protease